MIYDVTKTKEINEGFSQSYMIDGDLEILVSSIKKNVKLKKHNHNQIQFGYCFNGSFDFFIEDSKFELTKGESYLLAGGYNHYAEAKEDFYALDLKYISHSQENNVFNKDLIVDEFNDDDVIVKNISLNESKIRIINTVKNNVLYRLEKSANMANTYILVSEPVIVVFNSKTYNLKPMRIYEIKLQDSFEIIIIEENKELVFLTIGENVE